MEDALTSPLSRSGESPSETSRPSKRPRTTLACQRCKSRKQKCDGREPTCSQCARVSAQCEYVASTVPKPSEQRLYVKSLERKVAELEGRLKHAEQEAAEHEPQESYRLADLPPESALSRTIRDLSMNASGYSYLGGTSNITLARVLEPVLHLEKGDRPTLDGPRQDESDPLVTRVFPSTDSDDTWDGATLTDPMADKLFQAYMEYIALLFPIMHSRKLRDMHKRREKPNGLFEVCTLHLVYALGGVTLTLSGNKGEFKSEDHYEAAMHHRAKIVHCIDRRAIIYLTLSSLYCLRAPRNPGPWTMIGLAVKLCLSLGLHRKACATKLGLGSELDKRLFWTCYCLDRDINLTIGRPPSICDHDIDCPLPLDLNEDSMDPAHFRTAIRRGPGVLAEPPTTLTYFIQMLKLKRITSEIQHTIYRVDKPVDAADSITENLLAQLNEWKLHLPEECSPGSDDTNTDDPWDTPVRLHWRDSYMIQYYSAIRFLLFPRLMDDRRLDPEYLGLGIAACSGVCRSFKRLHQKSMSVHYSPLYTMLLFLAGLTLVHCAWRSPEAALGSETTDALGDCTIMLYVMAERWPKGRRYRDTFERLKQLVLGRDPGGARTDKTRPVRIPDVSATPQIPQSSASLDGHAGHTMPPSFPNIIRDFFREPFSLWGDGSFDFNLEPMTPYVGGDTASNGGTGWSGGGTEAYPLENAIPSEGSFSNDGFVYPSNYDFDPVAFDFSLSTDDTNEYGGILEGLAGSHSAPRR